MYNCVCVYIYINPSCQFKEYNFIITNEMICCSFLIYIYLLTLLFSAEVDKNVAMASLSALIKYLEVSKFQFECQ